MTKKSRQKLNILNLKSAFRVKFLKAFFMIFKELSFAKNCLRPESVPHHYLLTAIWLLHGHFWAIEGTVLLT